MPVTMRTALLLRQHSATHAHSHYMAHCSCNSTAVESTPGACKHVRTCMRRTRPEPAPSGALSGADAAAAVACASARRSAACPAAVLAGRGLSHARES